MQFFNTVAGGIYIYELVIPKQTDKMTRNTKVKGKGYEKKLIRHRGSRVYRCPPR